MKQLTIMSTLTAALLLSACAVTSAGVKKGDERNLSRTIHDGNIERVVEARLKRADGFDFGDIDVEVAEGIMVLAGSVNSQEDMIEAERIAWSAPNVVAVGNELRVGPDVSGFVRGTKDSVLGSSIRSRLVADKNVKSRNINIETEDGIVYLLGVARTPEELARITQIASTTRGAREVVSYIKVHNGGESVENFAANTVSPNVQNISPQSGLAQGPISGGSIPYAALPNAGLPSSGLPNTALGGAALPQSRDVPGFLTQAPQAPSLPSPNLPSIPQVSNQAPIDPLAPYYRDPRTGERITLDPNTKTIPFRPSADGTLTSGLPSVPNVPSVPDVPYYIDPDTGAQIAVRYIQP